MNNSNLPEQKESANAGCVRRLVRAPEWVLERDKITQRQWRIRKRKDLKALLAAMKNYRSGCAYCPSQNGEVGALERLLESLWESHKEKNWPWRLTPRTQPPATRGSPMLTAMHNAAAEARRTGGVDCK